MGGYNSIDLPQDVVEITRPLIFIGHSMGGIVIAKVRFALKAFEQN